MKQSNCLTAAARTARTKIVGKAIGGPLASNENQDRDKASACAGREKKTSARGRSTN
jgi:hypothetical protein